MIDKLTDQELSNELKRLIKSEKALVTSLPAFIEDAADVVKKARINAEIEKVRSLQNTIGGLLLDRDEAAVNRRIDRVKSSSIEGVKAAEELLERLPAFSEKLSKAFEELGAEYSQLLELSTNIRNVNNLLLSNKMPQVSSVSLFIEPNNLHKLLKEQFRESFGVNTSDVFLAQKFEAFSIIDAVSHINELLPNRDAEAEKA